MNTESQLAKLNSQQASALHRALGEPLQNSPEDEARPTPPQTDQLDQYRILEKIGTGGMGVVYKAEHVLFKRCVALKMLREDRVSSKRHLKRFLREMQAVGRLAPHENVVAGLDARPSNGRYFFVMEYVDGASLGQLVQDQGPLEDELACDYIRQAALGLAHAHGSRLVHRDVKPSNLLVDSAGVVKVIDLGVALLDSSRPGTSDEKVLGTYRFMSPEQEYNPHDVGPQTDIYSLGVTLCYLLGGAPVFGDPTRNLPRSIQGRVLTIIERMTHTDLSQRYARMSDVAQDLGEIGAEDLPVVIAVMGTNGGVGKGTLINFIAQILADSGEGVAIVDYDLGNAGSTLHAMRWYPDHTASFVRTVYDHFAPYASNLISSRTYHSNDLWEVTPRSMAGRADAGQIWMVPALDPARQLDRWGVIANVPAPRETTLLDVTRQIVNRIRRCKQVRYVLIDCGAGANRIHSAAFASASCVFVVTSPDPAYHDEIGQINREHRMHYPNADQVRVATVVNQVMNRSDREMAKLIGAIGAIPFDPVIRARSHRGDEIVQRADEESDPLDLLATDYELGYSNVGQAIFETLRRMLPDQLPKFAAKPIAWWKSVPDACRWVVQSRKFKFQRLLAQIGATATTLTLTALLVAIWTNGSGSNLVIAAGGCGALSLAGCYWCFCTERLRRLYVALAQLPSQLDNPPRILVQFLKERNRTTLRRLHRLVGLYQDQLQQQDDLEI